MFDKHWRCPALHLESWLTILGSTLRSFGRLLTPGPFYSRPNLAKRGRVDMLRCDSLAVPASQYDALLAQRQRKKTAKGPPSLISGGQRIGLLATPTTRPPLCIRTESDVPACQRTAGIASFAYRGRRVMHALIRRLIMGFHRVHRQNCGRCDFVTTKQQQLRG
jgi:hypothetical protein